jgi:alkylhydroperoxidase family enzyme
MMARLPYRDREDLPESYRYLFDNLSRESGGTGNIFRLMAHSPRLLHQFMRLGNDLRYHTRLDPHLRELAILAVGHATGTAYEYVHHLRFAARAGVSAAQLAALPVWERSPHFSDQERAVLRYAEMVTHDVRVPDGAFNAVHEFLDDEQIVELTMNIAFYNLVVRFLEPLLVDLEHEEQDGGSVANA